MPKKVTSGTKDCWRTREYLIEILKKDYDFTCDLAANSENTKFSKFFSEASSFLTAKNIPEGTHWLNPPFSQAKAFYKKIVEDSLKVVSIYKCDNTETVVWQDYIFPKASWILFPKGRIYFDDEHGTPQKNAMFPCALFGFNVEKPENLKEEIPGFLIYR